MCPRVVNIIYQPWLKRKAESMFKNGPHFMIVYVFHEILFHNGRVIAYFYLTLKAAITTAADAVLNIFFIFFFFFFFV